MRCVQVGAVQVLSELDHDPSRVEVGASHVDQRCVRLDAEQPGRGSGRRLCGDAVLGHLRPAVAFAELLVEAACFKAGGGDVVESGREPVAHDGQRLAVGEP
jgi:hypothetical protein